MRRIDGIVIHCSATRPDQDIGVADITRWHKAKGWSDCGYHYVIKRDGQIETGRPIEKAGAHVAGYNPHTVGICLAGGVDDKLKPEDNFTQDQWSSLEFLVCDLMTDYGMDLTIKGHRDYPNVKKACPCFDVETWWDTKLEKLDQDIDLDEPVEVAKPIAVEPAKKGEGNMSKKLGLTVASAVAFVVFDLVGINLTVETMVAVVGIVASYLGVEGVADIVSRAKAVAGPAAQVVEAAKKVKK